MEIVFICKDCGIQFHYGEAVVRENEDGSFVDACPTCLSEDFDLLENQGGE